MRYFGAAAYADVITWPYRLIMRAMEIEGQREAAQQLAQLHLQAVADGMEQGKTYKPGPSDAPIDPGAGKYDLAPYRQLAAMLERAAQPWNYTLEKLIIRREMDEEADFDKFEREIGGLQA